MEQLVTIDTWDGFFNRMDDAQQRDVSCCFAGELFPFEMPALDPLQLLDEMRHHPEVRILRQPVGMDRVDLTADFSEHINGLTPKAASQEAELHMTLFRARDLARQGGVLKPFEDQVFGPIVNLWHERGLRWDGDLWPILFLGGSASATAYHIDPTPNLIYHLFGEKRYFSPKDPGRWCDNEFRKQKRDDTGTVVILPEALTDEHRLVHDNQPGTLVWAPLFSPHWVDASSFSGTMTFAFRNMTLSREGNRTISLGTLPE